MHKFWFIALTSIVAASVARAEVDFVHQVVPILKKHCVECHGGDESKGGFSMNTRALVLEADVLQIDNVDESLIIELLLTDDLDERMPPADKGKKALTPEEVEIFKKWIAGGVQWEPGFTFAEDRYEAPLKPRKVTLPAGPKDANPIDLIVAKHFKDKGMKFPEPADDATYLARVYQDLVGLPPSPEQAKALANGNLDRNAVVAQLLSKDKAYAEHWMTFWNDLLRNEYNGTGFITGGRSQVTSWLYKSLLENKPYDQFVQQLVAPKAESKGFIEGIKWRGQVNASQTTEIQFSQNISQVFLGINMKCASCHDSFVDRWTLKDAYSLAAIYSESPLELTRCDKPTGVKAEAAWIFPELGQIDPSKPRDQRLKQLAELITHPDNGRMQRTIVNRLWLQLMGRGIVHPVDAMNTEPWSEDLLDYLANHLVASNYDLKAVLKLIATSKIYQAKSEIIDDESAAYVFRGPVRKRMTAEQFLDSIRTVTGAWPEPDKVGLRNKKSRTGGQLTAVMEAHGWKNWGDRPIRAVFTMRDSLQSALGRPNREQVVTTRPSVLTTLEAINLANGPEVAGLMKAGAEKISGTGTPSEITQRVFLAALSRPPSDQELQTSLSMLGDNPSQEQVEDFLWSVFMLPEFLYIN